MSDAQTAPAPTRPAPETPERVTLQGATTIADDVVSTIAGLAVSEVPGVHASGSGTARAVEAVRRNVVVAVDRMTGLRVTEVNVQISDLFLPGVDVDPDPDSDPDPARNSVDEIDLTRFG